MGKTERLRDTERHVAALVEISMWRFSKVGSKYGWRAPQT